MYITDKDIIKGIKRLAPHFIADFLHLVVTNPKKKHKINPIIAEALLNQAGKFYQIDVATCLMKHCPEAFSKPETRGRIEKIIGYNFKTPQLIPAPVTITTDQIMPRP